MVKVLSNGRVREWDSIYIYMAVCVKERGAGFDTFKLNMKDNVSKWKMKRKCGRKGKSNERKWNTHTHSRALSLRSVVESFSFEWYAHVSNFNTLLLLHLLHSLYLWADWFFFLIYFKGIHRDGTKTKADSHNTQLLFNLIICNTWIGFLLVVVGWWWWLW